MPDVRDRQYLITVHKKARKSGLDLHVYNQLREQLAAVQTDLARLKDPLIPPHRAQLLVDPLVNNDDWESGASKSFCSGVIARLKSFRDEIRGDKKANNGI